MKLQFRILLAVGVFAGSLLLFTGVKHCRSVMRKWVAEGGMDPRGERFDSCCAPAAEATQGQGERDARPLAETHREKRRCSAAA